MEHRKVLADIQNLPERVFLEPEMIRENYRARFPEEYATGDWARTSYLFADNIAYIISDRLTSGDVYTNWPEMDQYLSTVMKNVIPPDLLEDEIMRPFLMREGDFNASMNASGIMFVNVGVWTYIDSEAALAALIAHEVAHYYCLHSLKSFVKRTSGSQKSLGASKYQKARFKDSQLAELEADSMAHRWLQASPYSMEGSKQLIRHLGRMTDLRIKRMKNSWEEEATSHPVTDDRWTMLQGIIVQEQGKGSLFVQDESEFLALKKQAVVESLESRLRNFEYRSAVELSFKYHLFEPDDPTYVYFLMEAIRRMCYRNTDKWKDNFIVTGYYEEKKTEDVNEEKVPMTGHLFEKFDPSIMSMSPAEMRSIKARFYWDGEVKFKTNEQAFMFYYQLGKLVGCEECELSEALSQVSDEGLRDKALTTYTSFKSADHKDYANSIMEGSVRTGIEKKKLTVLTRFLGYVNQGQDPIPVNVKAGQGEQRFINSLDSAFVNLENRQLLYLPGLKEANITEYMMLQELWRLSEELFISKGVKPELHLIDPRYIELFTKYGVDEIEFVQCRYTEYRKAEKTLEEYINVTDMSFESIESASNTTRYLEVYVSSVRSVEKGRMKYQYYSDELKMNFKEKSGRQIMNNIISQMKTKDDRMKKDHYRY
jgi:hypothetical protein